MLYERAKAYRMDWIVTGFAYCSGKKQHHSDRTDHSGDHNRQDLSHSYGRNH